MEDIFTRLINVITTQQATIDRIAQKLQLIETIGGGSASIEDYESGKHYKRNALVVDPNTETLYRVLAEYTSVTVEDDLDAGLLKLVGFESAIVTKDHNPSQEEIDALPDDTLVAVYSSMDAAYVPDVTASSSQQNENP